MQKHKKQDKSEPKWWTEWGKARTDRLVELFYRDPDAFWDEIHRSRYRPLAAPDMTLGRAYQLLSLPINATQEQIKAAYRAKLQEYHPDVNKLPNAHERTVEIIWAYKVLRR